MTKTQTGTTWGYSLEPGTVYARLDDALSAASCLSVNGPATVYGTTEGPDVSPESEEAYRVSVKGCVRPDGSRWDVPPAPYAPIYTITHAAGAR